MAKFIYLIKRENEETYKIGNTKNIKQRIAIIQTSNDKKIELVKSFSSNFPTKLEIMLHQHFKLKRGEGEWFYLNLEDVEKFLDLCEQKEELLKFLSVENNFFHKI